MHKFTTSIFLVVFSVFLVSNAFAQSQQALINVIERNINEGLSDIKNRSIELERIRNEANKPLPRNKATFPEIQKDFEKIQTVNAEKIQKNAVNQIREYRTIAKATREINKRAGRLKSNLFPEEESEENKPSEVNQPDELTSESLKSLIISLDNAIYHFVSSPIFQNLKVVNPKESLEAKKDLELIIILSEIIGQKTSKMK